MFKGPGKVIRDNKSSSYPVFELTGVNCIQMAASNIYYKGIARSPGDIYSSKKTEKNIARTKIS